MPSPQKDERKPATAARIYDYFLGGTHNFPADREAASAVRDRFPLVPAIARANRAFLRRAVRYLTEVGVRQFLDIGSGLPTEGNVHEIAPDANVVYVDIDPVAVAESQQLLKGSERAWAIRGDLREPNAILWHRGVRGLLDFDEPIGLLLVAVLHFVSDDRVAYDAVNTLRTALAGGSHLVVSHATMSPEADAENIKAVEAIYERRTATTLGLRSASGIARFFEGFDLVPPGLVWLPEWNPAPDDPTHFVEQPALCGGLAGVGRLSE